MKKIIVSLVLAAFVATGAFAQIQMSAGLGGNLAVSMMSMSHPDVDLDPIDPVIGGGFHAFFDATYATLKVGMLILGETSEDSYDTGYGMAKMTTKMTSSYLTIGVLGKFPIDLGSFVLFPMLGFEYNMFLNGDYEVETKVGSTTVSASGSTARGDVDKPEEMDMILVQLGVGADISLGDKLYLRPTILWGIDFNRGEFEKDFEDNDGTIFKHKLDIGIAVGFKF